MQLDTARLLVSTGSIRGATLDRILGKWCVRFDLGIEVPKDVYPVLEGARGKHRTWSDLDRAVDALHELGIAEVNVKTS